MDVPVGYAAVGGFNANTPGTPGHVFQVTCASNCGSFAWADKSGDLPDIPVDSVIVNPNNPQQVFAGSDFGVYYTDDITVAFPAWNRFNNGIPHVMIWDMQVDRGATTLSVWTRGRGAFVFPLPSGPISTPTPTPTATATACYCYCHCHCNCDGDVHTDTTATATFTPTDAGGITNADSNGHIHAYGDRNGYCHCDRYLHADANSRGESNAYSNSNCDSYGLQRQLRLRLHRQPQPRRR